MMRNKLHTMVKRMSSKIVNGVQDGMDSAWVENWLDVLLRDAGVDVGDIAGHLRKPNPDIKAPGFIQINEGWGGTH